MDSLLLTLGHNSSAILVRDGKIIAGYEEERVSRQKSDSRFPRLAIDRIKKTFGLNRPEVLISHWFINGELPVATNKYYDPEYIQGLNPVRVLWTNRDFTHHDAHAYSAVLFGENLPKNNTLLMVLDGFGNFGETASFYKFDDHDRPYLIHRSFGFDTSLGLMYQYATAYLGMKMHEDEYKLLGYEAYLKEAFPSDYNGIHQVISAMAMTNASQHYRDILDMDTETALDPVLSVDALPAVQLRWNRQFDAVLAALDLGELDDFKKRVIISVYVQMRLEMVAASLVRHFGPVNLLLAGGVFYNVKLNNLLSKMVRGKTCVMPLAGDQGAALGIYKFLNPDFKWPGHVFWGHRDLDDDYVFDGIKVYNTEEEALDDVHDAIMNGGIVNLVRGAMEFGPRTLCNTSTLCLPTKENVELINQMNGRATVMPMAGVTTLDNALDIHCDIEAITDSMKYMVITRDYKQDVAMRYLGAAHGSPISAIFTGRTQIIDEDDVFMCVLLENIPGKMLINTSFNYHGVPICLDSDDVIYNHQMQCRKAGDVKPLTIIIKGK